MAFGVRIAPQDQAERQKANAKRPGWHGRTTLTGAITALSGQTLTLRVTDGTTHTLGITTSTTVYRVVAATPTQLQAGSFVTVSAATVAGRRSPGRDRRRERDDRRHDSLDCLKCGRHDGAHVLRRREPLSR